MEKPIPKKKESGLKAAITGFAALAGLGAVNAAVEGHQSYQQEQSGEKVRHGLKAEGEILSIDPPEEVIVVTNDPNRVGEQLMSVVRVRFNGTTQETSMYMDELSNLNVGNVVDVEYSEFSERSDSGLESVQVQIDHLTNPR